MTLPSWTPCSIAKSTTASAIARRPWQHRCWIFPRDPEFALKAGRILDLYQRRWQGKLLRDDESQLKYVRNNTAEIRDAAHETGIAFRGTAQTLQDLYDIAVKFAATIGDGINPAGTRALEAAYADLITLLEGKVQPALRQGRYPDRKTAQRISEVVRAVARELDH